MTATMFSGLTDLESLSTVATGRDRSIFSEAVEKRASELKDRLDDARVLVTGGGGTIGSETVHVLSRYPTAALHVTDISENYLADLVRDLRNRPGGIVSRDFRTFTLDYGGSAMASLLGHEPAYDLILNFAAHKHVRGERDGYSLLSMIDTNILRLAAFKAAALRGRHGREGVFSVSTDKAANPTSFMGASKRIMEDVLFDYAVLPGGRTTTARFANVAFSNGSLLQAMLRRLSRGEPVAVPEATRRYFVSPREAGELCMLAAVLADDGGIAVPDLDPAKHLVDLQAVAEALLARLGLEARLTRDPEEAMAWRAVNGRYPVLLTPLDTSGEKPYEEFVAQGEAARPWLPGLHLVDRIAGPPVEPTLARFAAIGSAGEGATADLIGAALRETVEHFSPRLSTKNLDQRL